MDGEKENPSIFDNPAPSTKDPDEGEGNEGEEGGKAELTPEQLQEIQTKSSSLEETVTKLQEEIAQLKTPLADATPPAGEDWTKVPPAQRPWFVEGSTNKPNGWGDVVTFINKAKEEAQSATINTIAEVIQNERARQLEQDQILEGEVAELKTAGQIKTDEQEVEVLNLHKEIYGNIPLQKGQIKTAFKIWQERQKGGVSSEEKIKQMKELAGKASPGGGDLPEKTPPTAQPPARRSFSLQDAAAEALSKMRRK